MAGGGRRNAFSRQMPPFPKSLAVNTMGDSVSFPGRRHFPALALTFAQNALACPILSRFNASMPAATM